MCSRSHTHFLHLFLSDWGGQPALSVSTWTPLSADQKLWSRYDGEPLNRSAHNCIFHVFPFSSLCLFSSLFLQQGAGLVRSSSSTISLRCTLPSCCFPLIKELLDKWLGRTESSAESNIFPAAARCCMPMTAKWRWKKITLGLHDDRGCSS